MKVIFFGTGAFGLPSLDALRGSPHELLTVVTGRDKPKGRHLHMAPSPVKEWALQNRISLFEYKDINSRESLARLREMAPDVFIVIDFGVIFSKAWIDLAPRGAYNIHPSLLPRHRGAAPLQWALLSGDAETGVSLVRVVEKLDAGDIVLQERVPIGPADDFFTLEDRLSRLGGRVLLDGMDRIGKGGAAFTPQDEARATYARKIRKEDGHLSWDLPAGELWNRIRALKHWPGAYFFYDKKRILVIDAEPADAPGFDARPGTVLSASAKDGIRLAAGDGALVVKKVQLEGRKAMDARDFINGFRLEPGHVLE